MLTRHFGGSAIQESDRTQQKNAFNPINRTVDAFRWLIYSLDQIRNVSSENADSGFQRAPSYQQPATAPPP